MKYSPTTYLKAITRHPWFALSVIIMIGLLFLTKDVSAHGPGDFDFTGVAEDACHTPGETWSIEWTIANDPGENPFGIVDADTSDGQDVVFAPLLPDVGDGYIPDGDDAHATTTHASGVASVTLEVEHDVTNGPNTFHEATVGRPAECIVDDASITVRKDVIGVSGDPTDFKVDFSHTVPDITAIDETDGNVTRGGLTVGLYVLTETSIPTGYEFVSWVCESDQIGADIDEDKALANVSINLRAAEDIFCVLTNRPKPPATPTPTATTVPPTATPVPPTATPVPAAAAPEPDFKAICAQLGGVWNGFVCTAIAAIVTADQPPAITNNQNVTLPPGVSIAPVQQPALAQQAAAPSTSTFTRISPPSTGDGGLADADSACWYHGHYRLVTHYDEYGSYQTYEFAFWHTHCDYWA